MANHTKLQPEARNRRDRVRLEAELDRALEDTFPASDPFSVGRSTSTEPPARPADRKAPRIEQGTPRRRRRKA